MNLGHIGVFLNGYPDPDGTTTAVRGLNRALARLGYAITIYCSGHHLPEPETDLPSFRVVHYERQRDHALHVPEPLCKRIRSNEDAVDFLVLHAMFSPGTAIVSRAARAAAIPYVVCPHDPYHPLLLLKHRFRKLVYQSFVEKPMLSRAAAIQVLDRRHAAYLAAFGIRTPIVVVPNGFDPDEAPSPQGSRLQLPGDPSFLCLGRLDIYHKGLDLLIEALSLGLRRGKLPRTLVVNFAGPENSSRERLERMAAQRGVAENINFAGRLSSVDRWAALRSCDVSILCSRFDGFGLSALETMVIGRPLILSVETGIYPWAREARCGFFVKPTAESIAEGLAQAVQSRSVWDIMGARGRAFAWSQMTWNRAATFAHEEYQALLRRLKGRQTAVEIGAIGANGD